MTVDVGDGLARLFRLGDSTVVRERLQRCTPIEAAALAGLIALALRADSFELEASFWSEVAVWADELRDEVVSDGTRDRV